LSSPVSPWASSGCRSEALPPEDADVRDLKVADLAVADLACNCNADFGPTNFPSRSMTRAVTSDLAITAPELPSTYLVTCPLG
jgi:hypothetical protein